MTYDQWAAKHPEAAADFDLMVQAQPWNEQDGAQGGTEAWAQQQTRMQVAKQGGLSWRNNVGALKTKEHTQCPRCAFSFEIERPPLRWGLANDSAKLNKVIKSSDLILCIPRVIQPHHVGRIIGQFGAIEVKEPGWHFKQNNAHERAQAAWLQLIASKGGFSCFSTGAVQL